MRKKWIRGGIFLCLVLLLLSNLNRILCVKSPHGVDQARYLYVQPKNKIDVLFLGSSHVHCNVNTQLLWDEYGMAAYLMTGAEQPLWNSYYNLKEALKTQKPKLVDAVDTLGAGDSFATAFLLAMLEKKDIHAAMEAGAEFAAKTCLVNGAFGHGIAFQEE